MRLAFQRAAMAALLVVLSTVVSISMADAEDITIGEDISQHAKLAFTDRFPMPEEPVAVEVDPLDANTELAYRCIITLRPRINEEWAGELAGLIAKHHQQSGLADALTTLNDFNSDDRPEGRGIRELCALYFVESSFNPEASNWRTGCYGLGQVRFHVHTQSYGLGHNYRILYKPDLNLYCSTDILVRYVKSAGSLVGGLRRYGTSLTMYRRYYRTLCAECGVNG